jgi:hypothetical protein
MQVHNLAPYKGVFFLYLYLVMPVAIEDLSEEAKYRYLHDKLSVHNVALYWSLSSWF